MINNAKLHSITIYKHEMDLNLFALTFKVGKYITRAVFKYFLLKYNLTINLDLLPKLFITKKDYIETTIYWYLKHYVL
jgi:hypothetical protein